MEGFKKANSNNLPELNVVTLVVFISKDQNFISPEISNVKLSGMAENRMEKAQLVMFR